ncbi:MAG TPA: NUDIX hydrolase [Gemmatimonadota bacterium]|nr:NUDIX hydrolase [Gemmatimonadota bacterium]
MAERLSVRAQIALFVEGELLCARHRKAGAQYLVLPGGHLDPGETLWEAAVREMREETGLTVEDGRLWAVSEFHGSGRQVLDCTFYATRWSGRPHLGSDPEGEGHPATLVGMEWVGRDFFADAPFRPTLLGRWLRAHWDDPDTPAAYLGMESP